MDKEYQIEFRPVIHKDIIVTWTYPKKSIDNCVAACKKNKLTLFKIIKSKDEFFAGYFDNRLFISPNLTYNKAAQMAKEKTGNDSLDNRLSVAKEFFLENYK